jgi:DNA polymerase I-like protein with 3'-5' exonuclease and polymerase domains
MRKHRDIPGQLPLWEPESDWVKPLVFPKWDTKTLGFDVESCDPDLTTRGPGYIRGNAKVIGYSLSDGQSSYYFPFAHAYGDNLPAAFCLRYLQDIVGDPEMTLIGANTMYEREALWSLGMQVNCKILDVQIAEPLINENIRYGTSLEKLGLKYLGQGKDEEGLNEAARMFGVDPKSGLWQLAPKYVGKYAEWDAWAPVHIWEKQMEEIRKQGLQDILDLELRVQPILWEMRKLGIPVDVELAKEAADKLDDKKADIIESLNLKYGKSLPRIDIWSGPVLAMYCDRHQIHYPRTPKGNPSFAKDFLDSSTHPFFKEIRRAKEMDRLSGTFIRNWIVSNALEGRVHPQWKQLASDDGGTKTGRMAASNPNPQQVPKRSAASKVIRPLFRAPKGKYWAKLDYSQQEPRILLHFAYRMGFDGAAEARQRYVDDPATDFYNLMMEMANIERTPAKDLYLGRCYGMGGDKLAYKLKCSVEEAYKILANFDAKLPFIKALGEKCEQLANSRGYIKTLAGRKRHFDQWEPGNRKSIQNLPEPRPDAFPVNSLDEAHKKWPGLALRRADTRLALNSLIQGSAADMTKAAMVRVWDMMRLVPVMQVHDELNFILDNYDQALEIKHHMETCVDLTVPIKADLDWGDSWAT